MSNDLHPIPKLSWPQPPVPSSAQGAVPEITWLALKDLRIARCYQRDILTRGMANVRKIVEEFRWTRFAPLVVARRPGGVFAVVDGQHRAAACLALGIARVPCQITECSLEEEAEAFAAINGNVTVLKGLQIFHARIVSGDRRARMLAAAIAEAGVTVPRNSQTCDVGMTLAIGTLQSVFRRHGAEILTLALRLVVETGGGNAGLLRAPIIGGLAEVLADNPAWRRQPNKLKAALDDASIAKLFAKAQRVQLLDGGPLRTHFAKAVTKAIEQATAAKAAA